MGKASSNVFIPIYNDMTETFNHIKYQLTTLDSQKKLFKDTVFRIAILNETRRLIGVRHDLISEIMSRQDSQAIRESESNLLINESNIV